MRSLMAVLAPLCGTRSSGVATVRSTTGGNVVLPPRSYAAPIVVSDTGNRQIARDKLLFTLEEVTVTPAGVEVPVRSLLGGERHNFPAGTELRWDPELTGIELVSELTTATTGGQDADGDAHVRVIQALEDLGSADAAARLFAARVNRMAPAIVIAWTGTPSTQRSGRGVWRRGDRWVAYIIVERKDGTIERGYQGMNLLDLVESYLGDRGAVDGCPFSDPPVTIVGASRHSVTPSSFVYALTIETHSGAGRIDTRMGDGQFADYLRGAYNVDVATTPPYPLVRGARFDLGNDGEPG